MSEGIYNINTGKKIDTETLLDEVIQLLSVY
jgi:hypothetical protein